MRSGVGTGFTRFIFGAIAWISGREVLPFDDPDEAKAWLVREF